MDSAERAAITRRVSLDSGSALHAHLVRQLRERRHTERERRRADRATVGRRIGDLAGAILRTNKQHNERTAMDIDYLITVTITDDESPIPVEIDIERAVEKVCEEAGVNQVSVKVERQ